MHSTHQVWVNSELVLKLIQVWITIHPSLIQVWASEKVSVYFIIPPNIGTFWITSIIHVLSCMPYIADKSLKSNWKKQNKIYPMIQVIQYILDQDSPFSDNQSVKGTFAHCSWTLEFWSVPLRYKSSSCLVSFQKMAKSSNFFCLNKYWLGDFRHRVLSAFYTSSLSQVWISFKTYWSLIYDSFKSDWSLNFRKS